MYQENEVIALIIAGCILFFLLGYKNNFKCFPNKKYMMYAFYSFFLANFFSVLEGFVVNTFCNILDHFFQGCISFFLLVWCVKSKKKDINLIK